jgi:Na+/H+ antiporter NhaD/arsenite permease-like protein
MTLDPLNIIIVAVFAAAYFAIILEGVTRVNKAAAALLGGALCWMIFFLDTSAHSAASVAILGQHLSSVSQIIFFLLGAMTIVELIDSHHGFELITRKITTRSKVRFLWIIGIATFFVSAVLDNLTSTIVMVSLLRKIVHHRSDRWFLGAVVVLCANAGGAWTPIGDVTTTLLWIENNLTTLGVIRSLALPAFSSALVVLAYGSFVFRGQKIKGANGGEPRKPQPGARLIFWVGISALLFVPIFKGVTGIPPYMAMFIGVAILWITTDLWHYGHHDRDHLKVPHALTRVDTAAILFFAGILLAVAALEAAGILRLLADFVDAHIKSYQVIATLLGLISSVIDNVPLVAASISMYSLDTFPTDAPFWDLVAYCAGTGGSLLIIGSAAGVVLMSLERVDFFWYLKRITPIALLSYFTGIAVYLIL